MQREAAAEEDRAPVTAPKQSHDVRVLERVRVCTCVCVYIHLHIYVYKFSR